MTAEAPPANDEDARRLLAEEMFLRHVLNGISAAGTTDNGYMGRALVAFADEWAKRKEVGADG